MCQKCWTFQSEEHSEYRAIGQRHVYSNIHYLAYMTLFFRLSKHGNIAKILIVLSGIYMESVI